MTDILPVDEFGNVNLPEISESKMRHMLGVAAKMRNMALERGWGIDRANDMYLLGLLHDIGYAVDPTNHSVAGCFLLKRNGYRYAGCEVLHHGKPHPEPTPELLLLWEADLTCDQFGCDITIEERLNSICGRYGSTSKQYVNACKVAAILEDNR